MNDAIWEHLRIGSGQSLHKLWTNLERLRRLGCKYNDLPATREAFQAGLESLLADGRASKCGELWMVEFTQPPPAKQSTKRQESLFA